MFTADWLDATFIHYRVSPHNLRAILPPQLDVDTFDGDGYVSVVAFKQSNLRPTIGGRVSRLLSQPLARHEFLNVRTYVRHRGDGGGCETRGIFFIAEWIPNRLAVWIGPRTYGLPYRLGRLHYPCLGVGRVNSRGAAFEFRASENSTAFTAATPGTLDHFLLERYTAFTARRGVVRRFDVEHEPWPQKPVHAAILREDLLFQAGNWRCHATLAAAHSSPGVFNVHISRPTIVSNSITPIGT